MGGSWSGLVAAGAVAGAVLGPLLTSQGLQQLARRNGDGSALQLISALVGGLAGAGAVVASHRANVWELVPALLVWGCALVAVATCDAMTQRIPTPLVRQAIVATSVLLVVGLTVHGDWLGLLLSGVASIAGGLTMFMCWRFAGAGFGDVRLTVLGGLGLGHATHGGLLLGFAALVATTGVQAGITLARGGTRKTLIPYGPVLAVGFLVAAAV